MRVFVCCVVQYLLLINSQEFQTTMYNTKRGFVVKTGKEVQLY